VLAQGDMQTEILCLAGAEDYLLVESGMAGAQIASASAGGIRGIHDRPWSIIALAALEPFIRNAISRDKSSAFRIGVCIRRKRTAGALGTTRAAAAALTLTLTFHLRCAVEQLACGTAQWQSSPRLGSATDKITHSLSRVSGELLDRATNHGGPKTGGASE
jgi:hypothetical protein